MKDKPVNKPTRRARRRLSGFTLIEMLIAIMISAILAAAMGAALNASLMAYSAPTESSSMQMSSRLVMQRTMSLIRTATLHDAYDPGDAGVTLLSPGDSNHPLETVGIQMQTPQGDTLRIWWAVNDTYGDAFLGDLWYQEVGSTAQMLIRRVTAQNDGSDNPYIFTLASRTSDDGLLLSRATFDIQVERDTEQTTELEDAGNNVAAIRLVGSTVPRKNLD